MLTSKSLETKGGRHRKARDRGFSAVDVIAAATVVSGVIVGSGVLVAHLDDADRQVATVKDNTATLKFKANYVATAAAVGAGSGNSFVRYTLSYK